MRFYSKIDWWYWAILVFIAIALAPAVIATATSGGTEAADIIVVTAFFGFGLPVWMATATYYEVVEKQLNIRSGPFRWQVPIEEISAIAPSRSVLSSPALSLDRLELTYSGAKKILISPKDKDGFIAAIEHDA